MNMLANAGGTGAEMVPTALLQTVVFIATLMGFPAAYRLDHWPVPQRYVAAGQASEASGDTSNSTAPLFLSCSAARADGIRIPVTHQPQVPACRAGVACSASNRRARPRGWAPCVC